MQHQFRDAVEREVRRFAVGRTQLEAALSKKKEDLLAAADSSDKVLRTRQAAVEKAEGHVQAYVRDSADTTIYFAVKTGLEIPYRTMRKRILNGYVPGTSCSGTLAVRLRRMQPLTITIGPGPPHHLTCLRYNAIDGPKMPPFPNKTLQVGLVATSLFFIHICISVYTYCAPTATMCIYIHAYMCR